MKLSRILVATDLSENAIPAARSAQELGASLNVPVEAIHVVDLSLWKNRNLTDIWRDAGLQLKVVEKVKKWFLLHDLKVPAKVIVDTGTPSRTIRNVAADQDDTLVVIAMSGRGAWNRLVFGSTALQLTNPPSEKLLVVHPDRFVFKEGMGIAVGTDFSATSQNALHQGAELARKFGSVLHIVYSTPLPTTTIIADEDLPAEIERTQVVNWAEDEMKSLLVEESEYLQDLEVQTHILNEPPVWGLRTIVEREGIDLMLLGHRRPEDRKGSANVKSKWVQQMNCSTLLICAYE